MHRPGMEVRDVVGDRRRKLGHVTSRSSQSEGGLASRRAQPASTSVGTRGAAAASPLPPAAPPSERRDAATTRRQLTLDEVEALLPVAQEPRAQVGYRGRFEGLWTDRADAARVIERRVRAGQLTGIDVELIEHWIEHGYVILPTPSLPRSCERGHGRPAASLRARGSAPPGAPPPRARRHASRAGDARGEDAGERHPRLLRVGAAGAVRRPDRALPAARHVGRPRPCSRA